MREGRNGGPGPRACGVGTSCAPFLSLPPHPCHWLLPYLCGARGVGFPSLQEAELCSGCGESLGGGRPSTAPVLLRLTVPTLPALRLHLESEGLGRCVLTPVLQEGEMGLLGHT
jgi:hypothetical protein